MADGKQLLLGITLSVATIVTLSPDLIEKIKEKDDQSRDIRQAQVSFHPALLVTSGVSIDEFVDLIGPAKKDAEKLARQ